MTTWTTDRPTKPGKYWLSVHPDKRPGEQRPDAVFPHAIACEVTQVVEWMLGEINANALDHEQRRFVWAVKYLSGGAWLRLSDSWFDGAQWLPYVEPPDPFAEPVPVEMYRMSDDAKTPNLRLILSVEPGEVVLYEADMTSRSATAKETAVHDKIIMSPADARWLRDALQQANLSDPPEVTSAAPVPSLRERVEGLTRFDLEWVDSEMADIQPCESGEYLKRSEVLALLDEVTR